MNTEIMKNNIILIDSQNPDSNIVMKTAEILNSDELVVAPTETRYGLLGRADSTYSIEKIYKVKKRPKTMPTALFVNSIIEISNYAIITPYAVKLANKFLPGPLTLVMKANCELPPPIIVDNKIGIRYSSSPFIEMLLNEIDFPVTATSANISQAGESSTISEIVSTFGDEIGLYVDVGELTDLVSTVVDVSTDNPVILREGAITEKEIFGLL
jgi:L-threonylcarbamoyladenylate synthase